MSAEAWLFSSSVVWLGYVWIGYPLVLEALSLTRRIRLHNCGRLLPDGECAHCGKK